MTALEDDLFEGPELCLDEVRLVFDAALMVVRPVSETDEIAMAIEPAPANASSRAPRWCRDLVGKVLQTVWLSDNAQGYCDQMSFAFGTLSPTLAFVCEGSILKVFRYQQVVRREG